MVHSNKQLEVSNAGFSGCPHPLPLASNRKGDPRLRSIATQSDQLEKSRQREDIVYRLCVQLAIVCLVISTTRKEQGLDDSFDFPCCMRLYELSFYLLMFTW